MMTKKQQRKLPKLDTLVEDIYSKIEFLSEGNQLEISEADLDTFGKDMADALKHWSTPQSRTKDNLRMSNIGKPLRRLWFDAKTADTKPEVHSAPLQIKFLYGHLLEVLILFFVRMAGHTVTSEQKEISVDGVKGHMDCVIDGEVIDVKTASGFAFKKFRDGTLADDDVFGYLGQLAGYEKAENTSEGGFLVMNKETGELTTFIPDDLDKPNINEKIKEVRSSLAVDTPPAFCYNPVPEGVSGNMKLARGCTWCPHKIECHKEANEGKGLRAFKYAKGLVYLTKVLKEPKVQEI
tara:strand:- start:299 stop:1180 length:882 start_codon:yes stop_codon:yes gene_type:complete